MLKKIGDRILKKYFLLILILLGVAFFAYTKEGKLLPYYEQLTKPYVGVEKDLQDKSQKKAHFVGSQKCQKCHKENYHEWSHSGHPKMIQDVTKNPKAIVANFLKLPADANFKKEDVRYTIGGKFKQRYMLAKDFNGSADYVVGNYQWNVQTGKWQHYKTWHYWYKDAYPHDNMKVPTSKTCDGCHFTGYMAEQKRVETGISCEACHGPGSEHVKNPKSALYVASKVDPVRQNEVCLQCHMRNRDNRLKDENMSQIYNDAYDYPKGYEAGRSLAKYKMVAPFEMGHETGEFYANGMGKHNRTQGNEYVHSMMGKHGITCINCHDPHTLQPTAQHNTGNKLCMKCHSFDSIVGPHEKTLQAHTHHKAGSSGSLCVECHMPKVGRHTGKSPLTVRSHMFGFVTPAQTLKYKMPKETNACYACHATDKKAGKRSMKQLQKDLESWGMVGWDKR